MSVDRRSPAEPPRARVTFVAPSRTFERLLKEPSLRDLRANIKRKLGLDHAVNIVLAQVRGERRIDLEDDDDFDAFRAYAHSAGLAEVSVTISSASQIQKATVQAEESAPNREPVPTRKKKQTKAKAPAAETTVNANADAHASTAPVGTSSVQSGKVKSTIPIQPIQSVDGVVTDKVEPVQHGVQEEKKAKRKRKKSLAPAGTASETLAASEEPATEPSLKKRRKHATKQDEPLTAPSIADTAVAVLESYSASKTPPVAPAVPASSSEKQESAVAESVEATKQKKPRKKKGKTANSDTTTVTADPTTAAKAQPNEATADLTTSNSASAPDAPRQSTTEVPGTTTYAEPDSGKKRKGPKGLEQTDPVPAAKDAVIPRKRRKVETTSGTDGPANAMEGKSAEDGLAQASNSEADLAKPTFQRSLADKISQAKPKKKAQLPDMDPQAKDAAFEDVFATVLKRHRPVSIKSMDRPAQDDTLVNQDKEAAPAEVSDAPIALKESVKGLKKGKTKKDKRVSEVPQTATSLPSTSAAERNLGGNEGEAARVSPAQLDDGKPETGRSLAAATRKAGAIRASKAASLIPPEADLATEKHRGGDSAANDGDDTHGPGRGSGDHAAGLDKVINPVITPLSVSALPFAPSGSSITEVVIQGNEESSSSDSDKNTDSDTDTNTKSENEDESVLSARQAESVLGHASISEDGDGESLNLQPVIKETSGLSEKPSNVEVDSPEPSNETNSNAADASEYLQVGRASKSPLDSYDDDTTAVHSKSISSDQSSAEDVEEDKTDPLPESRDKSIQGNSDANVDELVWNGMSSPLLQAQSGASLIDLKALNAPTESIMTDGLANAAVSDAMDEDDTAFLTRVGNPDEEAAGQAKEDNLSLARPGTPPRPALERTIGTPSAVRRMKDRYGKTRNASTLQSMDSELLSNANQTLTEPLRRSTRRTASVARAPDEATSGPAPAPSKLPEQAETIPAAVANSEPGVAKGTGRTQAVAMVPAGKAATRTTRARGGKKDATETSKALPTIPQETEQSKADSVEDSIEDPENEESPMEETVTRPNGSAREAKFPKVNSEEGSRLAKRRSTFTQPPSTQLRRAKPMALSQPLPSAGANLSRLSSIAARGDELFSPSTQAKSQPLLNLQSLLTPSALRANANGNQGDDDADSSSSSADSDNEASHIPEGRRAGSKATKPRLSLAAMFS